MSLSQLPSKTIVKCCGCGRESPLISQAVSLCPDCLRSDFAKALPLVEWVHQEARKPFHLPVKPPEDEGGKQCNPQFLMGDLPTTSGRLAHECLEAAKGVGLKNVRSGNTHLLGDY